MDFLKIFSRNKDKTRGVPANKDIKKPEGIVVSNITPAMVLMAFMSAQGEDNLQYLNLAYQVLDTHYQAGTVGDNRCEAVASLKRKVIGKDEKIIEFLEYELNKINRIQLKAMAEQTLIGRVVMQVYYKYENGRIVLDNKKAIQAEDLRNFRKDKNDNYCLIDSNGNLEILDPLKFIFGDTKPLMLRALEPVMYNKFGWKVYSAYLEAVSIPGQIGTYQPGTPKAEIEELYEAVSNLQSDSKAVISGNCDIKSTEGGKVGQQGLYSTMIEKTEAAISKLLNGQNLTTEVGANGSYAAAQVHRGILDTRILFTADTICDLITEQLIPNLLAFNFPNANPDDYEFFLYKEDVVEKDKEFVIDKELFDRGIVDEDYLQAKYTDEKYMKKKS